MDGVGYVGLGEWTQRMSVGLVASGRLILRRATQRYIQMEYSTHEYPSSRFLRSASVGELPISSKREGGGFGELGVIGDWTTRQLIEVKYSQQA
jgi:hypothetical protein